MSSTEIVLTGFALTIDGAPVREAIDPIPAEGFTVSGTFEICAEDRRTALVWWLMWSAQDEADRILR